MWEGGGCSVAYSISIPAGQRFRKEELAPKVWWTSLYNVDWCGKKLGYLGGITGAIQKTAEGDLQKNAPCWTFPLLSGLDQLFGIASR